MEFEPSSLTNSEPSGATATATGRPQTCSLSITKPVIYVAQRFMWRSLLGGPDHAPSRADKRHITFRSETAKELHDAWVLAPHLSFVPFPTRVTGCQRLCLHLKIDFGVNVGSVDGNMPEPCPDRVDVHAST